MKLYTINTGYFKLDGGAMFGVVPKSIWNKLNPADDANLCNWAMRCLLIVEGDKKILIDTGIGDKQDEKFFSHYYLNGNDSLEQSLAAYGFSKDDITDVVHTHLHFDHCGGSIVRNEAGKLIPAFSNATYWSNKTHWKWATEPNDREKASFLKENILPIQESGQLQFITVEDRISFSENINIRFTYGHTESMMLCHLYKDKQIISYCADLIPSHHHIKLPYIMAYDIRPINTLQEKNIFLEKAIENNHILFFEHDKDVECCTLKRTEKGIEFDKLLKLKDL